MTSFVSFTPKEDFKCRISLQFTAAQCCQFPNILPSTRTSIVKNPSLSKTTVELESMPKPFPYPLNIGTDIVHVKRIYDILTQYKLLKTLRVNENEAVTFTRKLVGRRFVHWVLNNQEIDDAVSRERIHFPSLAAFDKTDAAAKQRMDAMAKFLGGRFVYIY